MCVCVGMCVLHRIPSEESVKIKQFPHLFRTVSTAHFEAFVPVHNSGLCSHTEENQFRAVLVAFRHSDAFSDAHNASMLKFRYYSTVIPFFAYAISAILNGGGGGAWYTDIAVCRRSICMAQTSDE